MPFLFIRIPGVLILLLAAIINNHYIYMYICVHIFICSHFVTIVKHRESEITFLHVNFSQTLKFPNWQETLCIEVIFHEYLKYQRIQSRDEGKDIIINL